MTDKAKEGSRPRRAPLWLRGIVVFLVFAALIPAIRWYAMHHYDNVCVWTGEGEARTAAILYEEKQYFAAAPIGAHGITTARFPQGDLLGEVKPEGSLTRSHTFEVYAVKEKSNFLLVSREDGKMWVYYIEDIENPYKGEPETEESDQPSENDR